jgi:hypothetical protein
MTVTTAEHRRFRPQGGVFGLFEKKRDEMLRVMDGLRQWQR